MKRIIYLLLAIFLSAEMLTGCNNSAISNKGKGHFPECIVGVWKSHDFGWAFKFEPDGTIRKFRHMIAREVDMVADDGIIEMTGPEEGTYALFVIGLCEADYESATRRLDVKVSLDHYEMKLPNGILEGRTEDYFTGQISEDCKTWNVEWRPYGWLEGADPLDPNLVEANPEPLVFTKLDLSKEHNQSSVLPGNQ